ncbi:hypothetical protein PSN45_003105 [Yamadazyma tenuis]|uniref:Increased loss of mitochondrial DNA protein 1 n=1 Tax=Candida tenuis (strain ATCC 10573 / BCRC 21748 / CBS 615 / JCM 9827 / NBRC 10315 / NRRL Y-1498 / VKM Y-70) TaxID=590646 RepID=G3AZD7_CANTC|nr:uncharacterized protein CANTEDRAFT_101352 [Yamadazyma tenuis ATCC 10573]EGV66070.1 hypothetical protein CANTEDRAFT_101352 [Yamadazyma tenuis ATCC 10573]WEJ95582.1 hypothetical protein PSN45_003105 [Yamadazyma tenuis]
MKFLTSRSLIYIRTIFLFTGAFWVSTDPKSLIHSNFVLLLAEAMQLPIIPVDKKSPSNGLIAMFMTITALSDLIPCMADNVQYFETVVPTRLFGFFCLCAYTYLIEDRIFSNSVVFVYSFLEIWLNLLIFNNLRDEKYVRLKEYINEHGEEMQQEASEHVRVIED